METLKKLMTEVTTAIANMPLDNHLEHFLQTHYGSDSNFFKQTFDVCQRGIEAGWLCQRTAGGIQFGRAFKPEENLQQFSVDVVLMENIKGPHHSHPKGEIDLIMPMTKDAKFDEKQAGWCVYPPGSAHYPTVSNGKAIVLYLLPHGQIEFTQ